MKYKFSYIYTLGSALLLGWVIYTGISIDAGDGDRKEMDIPLAAVALWFFLVLSLILINNLRPEKLKEKMTEKYPGIYLLMTVMLGYGAISMLILFLDLLPSVKEQLF